MWIPELPIKERIRLREERDKEVTVGIKKDHQPIKDSKYQNSELQHQHRKDPNYSQIKTDTVTYIPTRTQMTLHQDHMI